MKRRVQTNVFERLEKGGNDNVVSKKQPPTNFFDRVFHERVEEMKGPYVFHTSTLLYVWNDLENDKRFSSYKFIPFPRDWSCCVPS